MPGNKTQLQAQLQVIFEDTTGKTSAVKAQEMADVIDTYVGTVKVAFPIPVTVAVPAGTGGTTAIGNLQ